MQLAVYADTGPKVLLADDTRRALQRAPFTHLFVNVEGSDGSRKVSHDEARRIAAAYPGHFLRAVLWPSRSFNREYVEWAQRISELWCSTPVLDLEHQWKGVADGTEALLLACFSGARVTTHLGHELVRRPATAAVARLAPEFEVQALSVPERGGKAVDPGGLLGPGGMQTQAIRLGRETNGKTPYITLPLYGQSKWPGGPRAAMEKQFLACKRGGAPGIAYWSLKHYLRNEYARDFVDVRLRSLL